MDDTLAMPGNGGINPGGGGGGMPGLKVVGQYIKDLSFENPGVTVGLVQPPQIELAVELQVRRGDAEHFEVEMKLRVEAKAPDAKPLFLLELVYAGLFRLQNIPEESMQPVLLIEAPHLLFPFARRIAADIVRDGGLPPLIIDPIDFVALYRAKTAERSAGVV